jgi:hypothetical protein
MDGVMDCSYFSTFISGINGCSFGATCERAYSDILVLFNIKIFQPNLLEVVVEG